jgi:hypothetical protein
VDTSEQKIGLEIRIAGEVVESETVAHRTGGYVLAVVTTIPKRGVAIGLQSSYVGHPEIVRSLHLLLGMDIEPQIVNAEHAAGVNPLGQPEACIEDHAIRLLDVLLDREFAATVRLPGRYRLNV